MLPSQIQRGLELVNQAPREAVQHFRQLSKDNPQDAEVAHGHARALMAYANQASSQSQKKSFLEKAQGELKRVTELDDFHPTAFDELDQLTETLSRLSISGSSTGAGSGSGVSSGTGNPSPAGLGEPGELKTVSGQVVKLEAQIGQGSYGVVYRGTCGGYEVAVKRFAVMQLSQKQLDEFVKETGIMRSVRSPHVMACRDVITLPNYYGLVMDYMAKGSLWHWLHNPQATFSWDQQYQVARNVTEGLSALHYHNVIHRDLKSLNVLIDKDGVAKLADFGLSKIKTTSSASKSQAGNTVGTLAWQAPELLRDDKPHTKASDVYSLGLIIWELVTREVPFSGKNQTQINRVKMLTQHETIPNNCPPRFAQLMWECWKNRPEDRPPARILADRLAQSNDPSAIDSAPNLMTSFPANSTFDTPWQPQQQPIMPEQIPPTLTKSPASPAGFTQSPHLRQEKPVPSAKIKPTATAKPTVTPPLPKTPASPAGFAQSPHLRQEKPVPAAKIKPTATAKPTVIRSPSPQTPTSPSGYSQSPHLLRPAPKQQLARTAFERVKAHSKEIKQRYKITDQEVKKVLDAVVRGRLEEVEAALKVNKQKNNGYCALLHVQADTTEAEQKFYEMLPKMTGGPRESGSALMLTPWQFALRESDLDMCDLILRYFDGQNENRAAAEQMNALKEDKELIRTYGNPFFDLQATTRAYKTLQDNWNSWSSDKKDKHWCEVIGKHQQSWPAWLRYDITQPGSDAPWCKQTVNARPQKRDASAGGIKQEECWMKGYRNEYGLGGRRKVKGNIFGFGWWRGGEFGWAVNMNMVIGVSTDDEEDWRHDVDCLDNEQAAVVAYREKLQANFATLLHNTSENASHAPR